MFCQLHVHTLSALLAFTSHVRMNAMLCNHLIRIFKTVTHHDSSAAPSAPIELKADRIRTTSVLLSWVAPQQLNGTITGYQVGLTPRGGDERLLDVEETTSTELTPLKLHTEYTIRVRAKTADYGEYSVPITVRTLDDGKWNM